MRGSALTSEESKWVPIAERLPKMGRNVLVAQQGSPNSEFVGWLTTREFVVVGSGARGEHLYWYPGGCPIENTTHWMEIPAL